MTFGARVHAAIRERGPFCAGIDPHGSLLQRLGARGRRGRAGAVRAHRGRGGGAVRLRREAAVGVLRAVRQPRRGRAGAGDRDLARGRRAGAARREARRHRLHLAGVRRRLPRPGLAAGRRRDHRQPLPRLRLAPADVRHRPQARRRRVRARAHLQQGGSGGPARDRAGRRHRRRPGARRAARRSTTAPTRSARSAPWSARPSATPTRRSTSTDPCSRPGTAPRAARRPTSGGSSGPRPAPCWPARRASCSRSDPTRPRCATAYAARTTTSPGSPDEAASPGRCPSWWRARCWPGCASDQENYCDAVKDHQDELTEIAAEGGQTGPARRAADLPRAPGPGALRHHRRVAAGGDAAWRTSSRPWTTPASTRATYDPKNPPAGLSDDEVAAIAAAADQVGSAETQRALQGLEQQALDVCQTPLSL